MAPGRDAQAAVGNVTVVMIMLKEGFDKLARALGEVGVNLEKVHNSLDGVSRRVDTLQATLELAAPYAIGSLVVVAVLLAYLLLRRKR